MLAKGIVIEAVQDVVEALYDHELRNKYIKFPESGAETCAGVETKKNAWHFLLQSI